MHPDTNPAPPREVAGDVQPQLAPGNGVCRSALRIRASAISTIQAHVPASRAPCASTQVRNDLVVRHRTQTMSSTRQLGFGGRAGRLGVLAVHPAVSTVGVRPPPLSFRAPPDLRPLSEAVKHLPFGHSVRLERSRPTTPLPPKPKNPPCVEEIGLIGGDGLIDSGIAGTDGHSVTLTRACSGACAGSFARSTPSRVHPPV